MPPLFGSDQSLILSDQSFLELKVRLHRRLLDVLKLALIESVPYEQFAAETSEIVAELLTTETTPLNDRERRQITKDILDELLGLGPLEPLLKDPTIADILVNTYEMVFVERRGRLELSPVRFKDNDHLLRIINKMVTAVGRRIDEAQPVVDARLADGSRINAVIQPVAVDGPLLSIRKFAKIPFDLAKLVEVGTLTSEIGHFLEAMVRGRVSILISGGTGTGKTTLLNAMSKAIDHRERIVTIEDAAELQLQQPHVARMETRPPNTEGKGEITQRDLVRNALRMRPDRIILGEVRSGEAFDMLQAMNTGHEGSLSTIHANTPRDAVSRLEQMIGMAGMEMSPRTIRSQIASAINVVIQIGRWIDGRRRITSIQEITGMEGDVVSMHEIFHYHRISTSAEGEIHGHFLATGIRPKFASELETLGIAFHPNFFDPKRRLE
ncbi:MAG TPA: CpaF family protein [Aliidongia sp.]|nr:CpaF family protein [Aliidongia sp.]